MVKLTGCMVYTYCGSSTSMMKLSVRANALCLLSCLRQIGPHARTATERRCANKMGQEVRKAEAVAHWHAHVRGRGLSRVEMLFVP